MMDRMRSCFISIAIVVAYVAIHSFAAGADYFPLDDHGELDYVMSISHWWKLLGVDVFSLFRPVKNLLFAFFGIWGDAQISRCIAIVIGIASYFPVVALFRRVFQSENRALAAAAIWMLAPTQVSCVAWLSCVNIQLMAGFSAAMLIFYYDNRRIASLVMYLLAMLSYESAISLPCIAILLDVILRSERLRQRGTWLSYVCFALIGMAYLIVRSFCSGATSLSGNFPSDITRGQVIMASASFLRDHLLSWFWPFGRMAVLGYYSPWTASSVDIQACWLVPIIIIAVAACTFYKCPRIALGLLFFLVGYLPVSNVLGFGNGPYGDYYLALSGMGLCVFYVEAVYLLMSFKGRARIVTFSLAVTMALVRVLAVPEAARYAYLWSNPAKAYASGLEAFPTSVNNWLMLLKVQANEGALSEIVSVRASLERALDAAHEEKSEFYQLMSLCSLSVLRDADDALALNEKYRMALTQTKLPDGLGWYHYLKGCILEDHKGDLIEAKREYMRAIEVCREGYESAQYFDRAALSCARDGELERAISLWKRVLYYNNNLVSVHLNLAIALESVGLGQEAEAHRNMASKLLGAR